MELKDPNVKCVGQGGGEHPGRDMIGVSFSSPLPAPFQEPSRYPHGHILFSIPGKRCHPARLKWAGSWAFILKCSTGLLFDLRQLLSPFSVPQPTHLERAELDSPEDY